MRILLLFSLPIIVIITIITELYLTKLGLGDPGGTIQIYFMDIHLKKIKKKEIKKANVSINDVGLRSIYNWKIIKKKIVSLVIV